MPVEQHDKRQADREKQGRQARDSAIGKRVLQALGQPGGLHRVQVQFLWDGHYRVNVLVGEDAVSAKVAHSYFLVANGEGSIVTSTPEITRKY